MSTILKYLSIAVLLTTPPVAFAQTTSDTSTGAAATADASAVDPADLLTQTELENLVAPIALYPDTLLIQVLVASTYPFDIVKADRFVTANATMEQEALTAAIAAEGYDASVEVLATAFPTVLADMAQHVEWTDAMGTVMLAQSDAVMEAVQTMRQQAINSGALISNEAQTVEVADNEVIIQPADPQVVYVPQYDPQVVYVENNNNNNDALITFGTIILIGAIFDNNNHWHNYWGCRNCAGWGGRPIINNPNVNIGVGGNVNIGNGNNIGWKPEKGRQDQARDRVSKKRGKDGATTLPINKPGTRPGKKPATRGDDLRGQLSRNTGAADISGGKGKLSGADRNALRGSGAAAGSAAAIAGTRPKAGKARAGTGQAASKRAATHAKVSKPSAAKAQAKRKPAARAPAKHKPSAMARSAPKNRSNAASSRGRASGSKHRGRR